MVEHYQVRLTRAALTDLDGIGDYLAQARGLDEAQAVVDRLREHVRHLDRLPSRGPVPKELDGTGRSDIRQTMLGPHRIFYKIDGANVSVFMFADGRRDIDALLTDRLLRR